MPTRIFIYDGRQFPDPDPTLGADQVKASMANFFPELANATTTERTKGDITYYTFERRVGTKGIDRSMLYHDRVEALVKAVAEIVDRMTPRGTQIYCYLCKVSLAESGGKHFPGCIYEILKTALDGVNEDLRT